LSGLATKKSVAEPHDFLSSKTHGKALQRTLQGFFLVLEKVLGLDTPKTRYSRNRFSRSLRGLQYASMQIEVRYPIRLRHTFQN
jgi:hypothetical protein